MPFPSVTQDLRQALSSQAEGHSRVTTRFQPRISAVDAGATVVSQQTRQKTAVSIARIVRCHYGALPFQQDAQGRDHTMQNYHVTIHGADREAMADLIRAHHVNVFRQTLAEQGNGYGVSAIADPGTITRLQDAGYLVEQHEDV